MPAVVSLEPSPSKRPRRQTPSPPPPRFALNMQHFGPGPPPPHHSFGSFAPGGPPFGSGPPNHPPPFNHGSGPGFNGGLPSSSAGQANGIHSHHGSLGPGPGGPHSNAFVPQSHMSGAHGAIGSRGGAVGGPVSDRDTNPSVHWQRQLEYANISRQGSNPHHHARAVHLQQRGHHQASSALAITDPSMNSTKDKSAARSVSAAINQHKKTDGVIGRPSSAAGGSDAGLRTTPSRARAAGASSPPNLLEETTMVGVDEGEDGPDRDEQLWNALDLGGMHLKNLSRSLFAYDFLTELYVPHNNLSVIPSGIANLHQLVRFDASGNKIQSLPPELGTLTSLRDLFLFDNHLTSLPPELGTLHQLDVIGIAGNPLPEQLISLVEKDGTPGLIAYLRDSCPVPLPPPEREWIPIDTTGADFTSNAVSAAKAIVGDLGGMEEDLEVEESGGRAKAPAEVFSVLSYNILCEKYASPAMYGYTPSWALAWSYRKEMILQEILNSGADVVCLQEVDVESYEDYFAVQLAEHDYEGVFYPKSRARTMTSDERRHVDGCATFYKRTVFQLVESELIEFNQVAMRRADFRKTQDMFNRVMTRDQIAAVALFEHHQSGMRLIVANAHIFWDPEYRDVKLVQVALLMDELERIGKQFRSWPPKRDLGPGYDSAPVYADSNQIPTIISGDFNSEPGAGVCDFLSRGSIASDHEDFMDHVYGRYTTEGISHRLKLRSSYDAISELPFTNYTPGYKGVIDYIWYTANSLTVTNLLGPVDNEYLKSVVGFPNAHYPSDHIPIQAEFRVVRPKA